MDESVVSEYKPKLLELISPHERKNIYNMDEAELLFLLALPSKSLTVKGEKCTGSKMSKERLKCYYSLISQKHMILLIMIYLLKNYIIME
jgi:hypothetical protein